ncbi:hypothetical protein [Methylocaldum szegediense]|uniref:hypothetical protein n=1 Tax=Methylocaldum szegediense TaxID=73780 RepID=UPI0012EB077C|nr:hypothetical protein [Methylocaldum szegediense]
MRLLQPFSQKELTSRLNITVNMSHGLPIPGTARAVYLQRDMAKINLNEFLSWSFRWKASGGKIIYDLDDDMLDAEGMAKRTGRNERDLIETTSRIIAFINLADLITVSTPALLDRVHELSPRGELVLLENCLDAELWQLNSSPRANARNKTDSDPIRIGYIGTPTHDQDLEIVVEAIQRIERDFGKKIEVEVIGAFEGKEPMFGRKIPLPEKNAYPDFVNWLIKKVNWDIGIIPLRDDVFNRRKSYLKFLEYSALRLAIICSDVSTYTPVGRHRENALMVANDTESWYKALCEMIVDGQLRERLASEAHRMVCERYTITANIDRYYKLLDRILAK